MDEMRRELTEIIRKVANAETAMVEKAVTESLTGGQYGVLIIRDRQHRIISADVNTGVPYDCIYVAREDTLILETTGKPEMYEGFSYYETGGTVEAREYYEREFKAAKGEPAVRPKRTLRAFLRHFRCQHHWVYVHPGDGRKGWSVCSFCNWRDDKR